MDSILIERSPSPQKVDVLGAETWPLKRVAAGRYTHRYTTAEECYLIAGSAILSCAGHNDETVHSGDLVFIPAALIVTWDVAEQIEYHWRACRTPT